MSLVIATSAPVSDRAGTYFNLPPEVYDRLRDRARRTRRSIAQEAAAIIEQAVGEAGGCREDRER